MNIRRSIAITLALAFTGEAQAIEPVVAERLAALTEQVLVLKREVASLRSVLGQDGNGNLSLTVAGDRVDRVGRNASTMVGQSSSRQVGGSHNETVGVDRTTQIGANERLTVQQSHSVSIGGNQTHQVAGSANVAVAHNIVLNAGDQLTLKSGAAQILLRKDGTIVITGKDIRILGDDVAVKGSGDVIMKGSQTLTN